MATFTTGSYKLVSRLTMQDLKAMQDAFMVCDVLFVYKLHNMCCTFFSSLLYNTCIPCRRHDSSVVGVSDLRPVDQS